MKNVKEITWEIFLPIITTCMACKEKDATHFGTIELGELSKRATELKLYLCADCIELEDEEAFHNARFKAPDKPKDFTLSDIKDSSLDLINPDWENTSDSEKTITRKINQLCRVVGQIKKKIEGA